MILQLARQMRMKLERELVDQGASAKGLSCIGRQGALQGQEQKLPFLARKLELDEVALLNEISLSFGIDRYAHIFNQADVLVRSARAYTILRHDLAAAHAVWRIGYVVNDVKDDLDCLA